MVAFNRKLPIWHVNGKYTDFCEICHEKYYAGTLEQGFKTFIPRFLGNIFFSKIF